MLKTVEVTVDIDVDDVLSSMTVEEIMDEIDDKELEDEALRRGIRIQTAAEEEQSMMDAEFLEDIARTIELGRPMDVSERRMAALRLREMIAPDNKRSSVIARKAA